MRCARSFAAAAALVIAVAGCGGGEGGSDPRRAGEAAGGPGTGGEAGDAHQSGVAGIADTSSPGRPEASDSSGAGASATSLPPMEVTGTATDTLSLRAEGPTLEFLPDDLFASAGERVLLRFENGGELPHNFALFRSDGALDRFVNEAYEAQATDYIPPSSASELVAYSPLLSPGKTAEMEFVVPPPGSYTFICLFPGHGQMMLGTLTSRQ